MLLWIIELVSQLKVSYEGSSGSHPLGAVDCHWVGVTVAVVKGDLYQAPDYFVILTVQSSSGLNMSHSIGEIPIFTQTDHP